MYWRRPPPVQNQAGIENKKNKPKQDDLKGMKYNIFLRIKIELKVGFFFEKLHYFFSSYTLFNQC